MKKFSALFVLLLLLFASCSYDTVTNTSNKNEYFIIGLWSQGTFVHDRQGMPKKGPTKYLEFKGTQRFDSPFGGRRFYEVKGDTLFITGINKVNYEKYSIAFDGYNKLIVKPLKSVEFKNEQNSTFGLIGEWYRKR